MLILADSAYQCTRSIITPFKDYGNLQDKHTNFNFIHSQTRIAIEHAFGLLKQRFRQLYFCKLRNIEMLLHFIRSCIVVHNICIDNNDEVIDLVNLEETVDLVNFSGTDSRTGIQKRNDICDNLFQNRN